MAARKTVAADAVPKRSRARAQLDDDGPAASTYFANVSEKDGLKFISSGCELMNAALGGGWVLGRVGNIVGDKSSGKTLLAIEACANFHAVFPNGHIRYAESEAAFDEKYAEALGMPAGIVDLRPLWGQHKKKVKKEKESAADRRLREAEEAEEASVKAIAEPTDFAAATIEDWYWDMTRTMEENKKVPILYILDSLDALSDEAEAARDIDDGTFGGNKPKKLGELFRRLVAKMEGQEVLLLVISQLRDKLNVTFGEKQTRAGGRALDFYSSHIVWLAEIGKIHRVIDKIDRVIGVNVKARVKKNKVGLPFRECEYPILFGYGVDDMTANVEWLIDVGRAEMLRAEMEISVKGYPIRIRNIRDRGGVEAHDFRTSLNKMVRREWQKIEQGFLPKASKY